MKEPVSVYTASVDCLQDESVYLSLYDRMPPARKEKIDRMRPELSKRLSLGAGALLLYALRGSGIDYTSAVIRTNEYGKPYLKDASQISPKPQDDSQTGLKLKDASHNSLSIHRVSQTCFSVSHSGSQVMCAVSSGFEVGCDIQKTEDREIAGIARFFTQKEQAYIAENEENFYRIWTLKESFMKMAGLGFSLPLKSFEVTLAPLSVQMLDTEKYIPSGRVFLKEYDQIDGYRCAVSALGKAPAAEMISIDLKEICLKLSVRTRKGG